LNYKREHQPDPAFERIRNSIAGIGPHRSSMLFSDFDLFNRTS
jgi:hypothetical protein